MKRTAIAIGTYLAATVGLEGAFLLVGTVCLAIFASYLHPAGALAVVGAVSLLAWLALSMAAGRR